MFFLFTYQKKSNGLKTTKVDFFVVINQIPQLSTTCFGLSVLMISHSERLHFPCLLR